MYERGKNMNIFANAVRNVQKYSTGIKELNKYNYGTKGADVRQIIEQNKVLESCENIEQRIKEKEKILERQENISKVVNKQKLESQFINKLNKITKEGKDIIFKDIIFEMFQKSLYLDDYFIIEQYNNLKAASDNFINENNGIKLLENAARTTGSPLLKKMLILCENTVKEVCQRKYNEAQKENDLNLLNFDLNEQEKQDYDYEKGKLDIDQVSDLVKQKVLTVIQDEKEKQSEEEELYNDIENQLSSDETVTDENTAKESLQKLVLFKNPIEESTIFNSLLRNSYKELLESTVVISSSDQIDDMEEKRKENQSIGINKSQATQDEFDDTKDVINNSSSNKNEDEINMDLALAEAITKYTLMEMLYTIQLENYDYYKLQKLSQKLLN
jgi:hypothetical protein